MIDLCNVVIGRWPRFESVEVKYAETALERLGGLASGRIDLLCGAITATLPAPRNCRILHADLPDGGECPVAGQCAQKSA